MSESIQSSVSGALSLINTRLGRAGQGRAGQGRAGARERGPGPGPRSVGVRERSRAELIAQVRGGSPATPPILSILASRP